MKEVGTSEEKSAAVPTASDSIAAAYLVRLKAYFPRAQIRYVDNVVRIISTHILDVPRGGSQTKLLGDLEPKYFFEASEMREGKTLDDLMKLKDDVERKRHAIKNRLVALHNLRQAIRNQPEHLANGVPNGVPNSF